jgi:hypothetical protein
MTTPNYPQLATSLQQIATQAQSLSSQYQEQGTGGSPQLVTVSAVGSYTVPIPSGATSVDMVLIGGGGGGGGYETAGSGTGGDGGATTATPTGGSMFVSALSNPCHRQQSRRKLRNLLQRNLRRRITTQETKLKRSLLITGNGTQYWLLSLPALVAVARLRNVVLDAMTS